MVSNNMSVSILSMLAVLVLMQYLQQCPVSALSAGDSHG